MQHNLSTSRTCYKNWVHFRIICVTCIFTKQSFIPWTMGFILCPQRPKEPRIEIKKNIYRVKHDRLSQFGITSCSALVFMVGMADPQTWRWPLFETLKYAASGRQCNSESYAGLSYWEKTGDLEWGTVLPPEEMSITELLLNKKLWQLLYCPYTRQPANPIHN